MSVLTADDHRLLLDLLALPTAGPLETGHDPARTPPALREAQLRYAQAASAFGFRVLRHAPAPAGCLDRDGVPVTVRRAAAAGPEFLHCQPSMVLGFGPCAAERPVVGARAVPGPAGGGRREPAAAGTPPEWWPDAELRRRTVMFNVHLDTVAGVEPVGFDGARFQGRGAIDAKGPAVALIAGLRAYLAGRPRATPVPTLLVQAVAGEEGGALGTFGTRPLIDAGYYGRFNVFCEPTGGRGCPRGTAAMTARISVAGCDAIDDEPGAGHNATVLLGFLAQFLATALDGELPPGDGQLCLAGVHTGTLHNRVYGTGELLVNISYATSATAGRLRAGLTEAVTAGLAAFAERFGGSGRFGRTAADAARITRVEWLKFGLPALGSQPAWGDTVLAAAGVAAWPPDAPGFTSDAIWLSGLPDTYTVVLGPGDITANKAHAAGEFAELADLEAFAALVPRVLSAFDAAVPCGVPGPADVPEPAGRPLPADVPEDARRLAPAPRHPDDEKSPT